MGSQNWGGESKGGEKSELGAWSQGGAALAAGDPAVDLASPQPLGHCRGSNQEDRRELSDPLAHTSWCLAPHATPWKPGSLGDCLAQTWTGQQGEGPRLEELWGSSSKGLSAPPAGAGSISHAKHMQTNANNPSTLLICPRLGSSLLRNMGDNPVSVPPHSLPTP